MAAGPLTSISTVKEYEETYLPLFLWEFTFTDGTWAGFCTHGLLPAEGGFTYKGRNYEGLVLNGDVAAAQAMSSTGVTMFPSLQLELDDADRVLTTNIEIEGPGFKGAQVILRFLFYDPTATSSAAAFSTDDLPLFLGSCITSPAITDATIRLTIQSLLHLAQGTLPAIHVQKRCPWIHPNTPEEKAEANSFESWFFNCGDTSTAAGHDHCDYTPSDCKRLGMWNPTAGILRFGGVEAELPPTWTGRPFGGDTETRDNAKNHTLDSEFVPHLYGRGWIEPIVVNMSGEANYTRMQLLVCYGQTMAALGTGKYSNSWKLSVNDIVIPEIAGQILIAAQVPINGFWSFVTTGARDGALCNQVGYQVSDGHGGLTGGGDPFGSMTVLYASVLRRVTESNQVPTVQLLADGGMIPVFNSDSPTDFTLKQTKNPVWQAIDMLMWGGRSYSDLRLSTFRAIAALADEQITASDRNGVSGTRPRFESSIVARHPRAIGDLLQGVLGSFGGYLVTTDKIELHMYQALCSEQPSPIPGSNDNTAYSTAGVLGGFNGKTSRGDAGTGYVAYSFDSSNIKEVNGHTSLVRMQVSMGDEPNTFSYTFQDSQNEYQLDTLTIPDVDAINRNSGQQIVAAAPFEGITTYDQAFRMGRRSIAIRTRGNPVGDPRGSWRMSMTASVKAVSLRLGHLVLLTAEEYGLDKQLFRIESIRPSLNFQEADLVMSWHDDTFYMDDYGVSGFPPLSGSRQESNRHPRVWQPFHKLIPPADPLYNGDPSYTFAMRQWLRDGELLTDSMIRIQGYPPITLTAAIDIQPPWFTDLDLVAETGGTLMPDQLYYVCIAVDDGQGKLSSASTTRRIHMPPTGGNRQFRIQNLFWRGGGDAYVFVGLYPDRLSFCQIVTGQPGSIMVGSATVPRSSWGPPDSKSHHFVVRWRESIHAGVYGGAIAQVMPGGTSLKISGANFGTNEWANRIMSVIGDANAPSTGDYFGVINCRIASNTADTLVLSGSGDLGALGVQAGDAIVIRTMANIVSSTTIGDSKFVNSAAPTGMGDEVIGREVVILWGTGMGQARTITAHTGTTVTVSQAWEIMPDAASVFVIEEIGWQSQETAPIQASSRPPATPTRETVTITDIPVQNWAARTVRVEVNVSDSVGKVAIDALSREIYLFATFHPSDIEPGTAPPAPNITAATVTTQYSCPWNDSMYGFSLTITIPLGDPNIGHLKKIRVRNSLTDTDMLVLGQPATGWTSPLTVPTELFAQARFPQSGAATFNCENDDGNVTAGPLVVPFTVQASSVTGFSFAGEVGARFIDPSDNPTRLVSCTIAFVPVLNGNQVPQSVYYLRSLDNGATWTGIGFQRMKAVDEQLKVQSLAPGVDSTWKIAACTGALAAVSTPITAANIATLFPGIQISAGFLVRALELPPANLITTLTVSAGVGGTYPYNTVRTDGSQYWKISSVTVADNAAVTAPDAFFLRVTAQDLGISHNAVAPEHPFAGDQVSTKGQTNVYGPLAGDYGTNGLTIIRSGNIAYVRLRVYLCNRVDQTSFSFQNNKCATLQTSVGGGLGYVDVAVSTDGSVPPLTDGGPEDTFNVVSVTASEVGPKYQDTQQGLHTSIGVVPVIDAGYGSPRTVTIWFDFGNGVIVWQGWYGLTVAGERIRIGDATLGDDGVRKSGDIWVPANTAQGNWKCYCKAGRIDNGGIVPSPANSAIANFTVVPVGVCSPNGTTNAMFVNDPATGDPITYAKWDPGIWHWEYYKLTWTPPALGVDPNYWFTLVTVQKGSTIGGVWTAAPDHEGINEDPRGNWLGRAHVEVTQLPGIANDQVSIIEKFGARPATWDIPPAQLADTRTPNPYREFRFLLYNVSRLGTDTSGSGGAGTYTLQTTCWPGGKSYFILTPQPQAASLDIRAANPATIAFPLKGGNGQPLTIDATAMDGTYLADDAVKRRHIDDLQVAAEHMMKDAITAGNQALAAASVVDPNIVTVGMNKVTYGTSVFAGDVVLSRGIGEPVIVLGAGIPATPSGIYLFGKATTTDGKSGLTTQPYTVIKSTGIGLFAGGPAPNNGTDRPNLQLSSGGIGLFSGGGQKALLDSSGLSVWYDVANPTNTPQLTVGAASVTLKNGSNYFQVNSNALTFFDGFNSNQIDMNSSGIAITKGLYKMVILANSLQLQYNGIARVTFDSNSLTLSNGGSNSVVISATGVDINNGTLTTISGSITVNINRTDYIKISAASPDNRSGQLTHAYVRLTAPGSGFVDPNFYSQLEPGLLTVRGPKGTSGAPAGVNPVSFLGLDSMACANLPSGYVEAGGAGSNAFWYDAADFYKVKYAA